MFQFAKLMEKTGKEPWVKTFSYRWSSPAAVYVTPSPPLPAPFLKVPPSHLLVFHSLPQFSRCLLFPKLAFFIKDMFKLLLTPHLKPEIW